MSEPIYVYEIFPSTNYKKTRKKAKKQGLDMDLLDWCIDQLAQDKLLPKSWKDHSLKGNFAGLRECHIDGSGNWLLVYQKRKVDMILYLVGTGSHSEVFGL